MAKTSMIERDLKRTKLVKKYAAKRAELKAIVLSATASYEAARTLTATACARSPRCVS